MVIGEMVENFRARPFARIVEKPCSITFAARGAARRLKGPGFRHKWFYNAPPRQKWLQTRI
jgi:hypothetical protein